MSRMDTPRPNWELSFTHQLVANLLFGLVALAVLVWALHIYRTERKRYALFAFLGSGLCVFYEPVNNVLGHCTYPEIGQLTWIRTLNRAIPMYIGFVYFFYMCGPVLWLMRRMEQGITTRQWWRYYAIGAVACTSFELIPIQLEWWKYYGDNQALRVLGFPMWWWFVNPMTLFATATVIHLLRTHLIKDRWSPLLVPLWPFVLPGVHAMAGLPIFTTLNTTENTVITALASVHSIGLAFMVVWICGRIVTVRPAVPAAPAGVGDQPRREPMVAEVATV